RGHDGHEYEQPANFPTAHWKNCTRIRDAFNVSAPGRWAFERFALYAERQTLNLSLPRRTTGPMRGWRARAAARVFRGTDSARPRRSARRLRRPRRLRPRERALPLRGRVSTLRAASPAARSAGPRGLRRPPPGFENAASRFPAPAAERSNPRNAPERGRLPPTRRRPSVCSFAFRSSELCARTDRRP